MRIRIDHIGFSAKGVRIAVVFLSFGFWISLLKVTVGSEEPLGVSFLKSRGLFSEAKMYWISAGALIGYIVLFNCLITLALTFLKPLGKSRAVVPPGEIVYDKDSKITELEERRSLSSKATSWRFDSINMVKQNGKRGMSLPFEPHSIIFYDIKYAVDMPKEIKALGITEDRLELWKGVSGAFRPGVLTALMGVSGVGKTTLMDVLAGRKTGGYISGNITISGYPKKQETFARIAGYCEQTDIHSPHLSLYESLQTYSSLHGFVYLLKSTVKQESCSLKK